MKIKIDFIKDLSQSSTADIAVLLPRVEYEERSSFIGECQSYAGRCRLTLAVPCFKNGEYISMAAVTGDGVVFQHACFLKEDEGFKRGASITRIESAFGPIALCCGADIFQPQYARTAAFIGCKILISSSFYEPETVFRAAWSAVQANNLPICAAARGEGRLLLPCEMTNDKSGRGDKEIDLELLESAYADFPVFDTLNGAFCGRYKKELEV